MHTHEKVRTHIDELPLSKKEIVGDGSTPEGETERTADGIGPADLLQEKEVTADADDDGPEDDVCLPCQADRPEKAKRKRKPRRKKRKPN